jgi:polyisoprenoid-binding protein YceI
MKNVLFLFAATLFLSAATLSKPKPFKVDVAKSTFQWTGKKVTGSHWGYVKIADGTFELEKGKVVGGMFNIDMTTIDCQDLKGGGADKLIGHFKSDDFFSVEKFPKATLKIKTVTANTSAANNFDVVADLTIKGISKEISFPATIAFDAKTKMVSAKADFNVNRTSYDIKYGSGSFFQGLGDKMIEDNFNVKVNLVAVGK